MFRMHLNRVISRNHKVREARRQQEAEVKPVRTGSRVTKESIGCLDKTDDKGIVKIGSLPSQGFLKQLPIRLAYPGLLNDGEGRWPGQREMVRIVDSRKA